MKPNARIIRVACAALAAAFCISFSAGSSAEDPYVIDVLLSMTGPATFLGHGTSQGIAAAEAVANKTGGINGRPVKFVIQDDQSNPQVDVQLASAIVAKRRTVMIAAPLAGQCNAMAPLVQENGPVLYCLTPSVRPPAGSYVFSINPATFDQVPVELRYFRQRGITRIAEITSNDASGQDAEHSVDTALELPENKGLTIVDREHFITTDISVAAQIARIKASNAQVLFAFSTGTPFGTILSNAFEAGLDLPILTTAGNLTYAQMNQYAPIVPKELYFPGVASIVPDQVPDRRVKAAVVAFDQALIAQGVKPEYIQSASYDPALLIVEALRKLGTNATAAQLRAYIANLSGWAGASGIYNFRTTPQRGLAQGAVIIVR